MVQILYLLVPNFDRIILHSMLCMPVCGFSVRREGWEGEVGVVTCRVTCAMWPLWQAVEMA